MTIRSKRLVKLGLLAATFFSQSQAFSADNELNLYSARHYSTDEAMYDNFTKKTGITIKRLELKDEALLERLRNEGPRSPADVVLLVDAARLAAAEEQGLFQPINSKILDEKIPDQYTGEKGRWFAFSARSRVIVYNKANVDAQLVQNYEDLAKPALKGKVCTRSGGHPYMLSLLSSLIGHLGEAGATQWAEGMVWSSPERHGAMTGIMKAQIDWIPLSLGAVRPTQGKTLAVMEVSGGSQSFNAVNQMRVLGRWMRMITIPNQSSVAKAFLEFDEAGRMKPSAYYERVVDVMEELAKFTLLTRDVAPYLVDRYSERRESAAELSRRVNQRTL